MSDTGTQLSCKFIKNVDLDTSEDVSAMLVLDENQIVLTYHAQAALYNAGLDCTDVYRVRNVGYWGWGIKDMSQVDQTTFAILIPGWFTSDVIFLKADSQYLKKLKCIEIDNCFGICFQKEFMFTTTCPWSFGGGGYVEMIKMINCNSEKKTHTFDRDENNKALFSNGLSKVHVDKNFRMFVCDSITKELVILKIDPFSYKPSVLARHKYHICDFTLKKDGTSFLATTSNDGVVLLQSTGKWLFNNFLSKERLGGRPTAVAFWESTNQLLVAVSKAGLFGVKKEVSLKIFSVAETMTTDTRIVMEGN